MTGFLRRRRRAEGEGPAARGRRTARRGLWTIARIISLITSAVVALIVVGILLVVFEANRQNDIVDSLLDAAKFLVGPLDDVFTPKGRKARIAVNWGLAAVIYALVGGLIVRLLRR